MYSMGWNDSATELAASQRSSLTISQGSTAVDDGLPTAPKSRASLVVAPVPKSRTAISAKAVLQKILPLGRNVLPRSSDRVTRRRSIVKPLPEYAAVGDYASCKRLVKQGVPVDGVDTWSRPALYYALLGGHHEIANLLLESGADVNPTGDSYLISLMSLPDEGQYRSLPRTHLDTKALSLRFIAFLTESGTMNENFWPMFHLLRRHGADMEHRDFWGRTPLIRAAQRGYETICQGLLDAGADLNAKETECGATALIWTVLGGHIAACKVLLDAGASPFSVDTQGTSAMIHAAKVGHGETFKLLLAHCLPEELDRIDPNLLVHAARRNNHDICHALLTFGADTGALLASCQTTALHEATMRSNLTIMTLLIHFGTDPNTKDHVGLTPLHYAALTDELPAVKLLLASGAAVDPESPGGRTPLIFAASSGNVIMVDMLLKNGADPHKEYWGDWSPWKGVVLAAMTCPVQWHVKRMERMRELMEVC